MDAPVTYAGFWKRFVAYLIDDLLLGLFSFLVFIPVFGILGLGVAGMGNGDDVERSVGMLMGLIVGPLLLAILAICVAGWLYFALMESSAKGATLGKMALGIRVTDLAGNRISFGRATGRYFGKIISSAILSIGYIMAAFTQQKQALHDIMAGCLVVNK